MAKVSDKKIGDLKNLDSLLESELNSCGYKTAQDLVETGWEEVCLHLVEAYPERLNLNAFHAIIGAIHDKDWKEIEPNLKTQARQLKKRIKQSY
ncbi:MAG: TfoX/Sxy family DNA transformation protein [Bdellovibrionales bacterium]